MPAATFEEVWESEFAPRVAARRRQLAEARTEAFLDTDLAILGEPVRQMTPRDLILLDALGNPFVAGAEEGAPPDFLAAAGLLWQLSPRNTHTASLPNLWRRARFLRRLAALDLAALAPAIAAYLDRMLDDFSARPAGVDAAAAGLRPEPRAHFLAPLLVEVTAELGAIDPASGALLADTPLPRLAQYARVIREQRAGERLYDEADSLRSACLARLNEINAAARAAAA